MKMKLIATIIALSCSGLYAGTPAQDKEFVDKYKAAWEKGDKAALESFLYIKDANPMALEFYKMMQTEGAGTGKITKIELVALTPEDVAKAAEVMTGPDGSKAKLPLTPTKKLKMTIETKDGNGSGTSSTENFIAEKDGKYVIPVPAVAK